MKRGRPPTGKRISSAAVSIEPAALQLGSVALRAGLDRLAKTVS